MSNGLPRDPDDFFAETRMSFGDHIEELRQHLWRAIYGFGVAVFLAFFIGHFVVDFITAPVSQQLREFYKRRQTKVLQEKHKEIHELANRSSPFRVFMVPTQQLRAAALGKDTKMDRPRIITQEEKEALEKKPTWWDRWVFGKKDPSDNPGLDDYRGKNFDILKGEEDKHLTSLWVSIKDPLYFQSDTQEAVRAFLDLDSPTTLNVQEAFFVWFKVCLVCGFVLGSPWIFWQIWMFVAAGLYPDEKRLVHVYLPISLGLFLVGVAVCEIFVIPKAIEALLWFNEWLGFKPDLRLNEWLSFAIFMPVIFGLSFQTPLVMLFLNRLGIVNADSFRNKRRYAWFGMAVFAAVCTPSTDAFSMLFLWVPMSLLFELGIILMKMSPPPSVIDEDAPEPDELIEV
jgi:sec-independent protein translocase protein TatC